MDMQSVDNAEAGIYTITETLPQDGSWRVERMAKSNRMTSKSVRQLWGTAESHGLYGCLCIVSRAIEIERGIVYNGNRSVYECCL